MPPKIRALLTALVILFSLSLWLGRVPIGLSASPILFFGLSLGICGAIWMFPETKNRDS